MESPGTLDETRSLVRRDTLFASQVDGETVIVSLETDSYYGFGKVGSRIWELLSAPTTVEALCRQLGEEYNVDPETCRQDTVAFLRQLLEQKLIVQLD